MSFCRKGYKKPKARTRKVLIRMYNIKKHGLYRAFCVIIISWGVCPKPRHKGLFGKSPLESQKFRQNKVIWSMEKFLRIFKGLFTKSTLKQGLERQFQHITKNKKRGFIRVFCVHYQLGRLPQTLTKETFREKFLGTSKALSK